MMNYSLQVHGHLWGIRVKDKSALSRLIIFNINNVYDTEKRFEEARCLEEAICTKDHARGLQVLAAWSEQTRRNRASKRNFFADGGTHLMETRPDEVRLRRTVVGAVYDQASHIIDVLAWSFA